MNTKLSVTAVILFVLVSSAFGDGPPYEDEDILGLEISGELLAPPVLVSQIGHDLASIRAAFPEVSQISVFPSWPPGVLIVKLTLDGWDQYEQGTFTALDSLNSEYGPLTITLSRLPRTLILEFEQLYHPELLASVYEELEGVEYAEPNYFGGDGDDISSDEVHTYTFKECIAGCIYADYWVFSVIGGTVELIAHYGYSVSAVRPSSPSLSHILREAVPNPFNPSTTIKYHLTSDGWIKLEIFDLLGRPVIQLVNEYAFQGEGEVSWHGVDNAGTTVGSGVYFCRLTADGVAQVQKLTLLK